MNHSSRLSATEGCSPPESGWVAAEMLYLEQCLQQECDWIRELSLLMLETAALVTAEQIAETERILRHNRETYGRLPAELLKLGLDISGVYRLLGHLDEQILDFGRLAQSLRQA
ncbi:MAG: hypothetical protein CVV27_10210 [Candidatus Melainabacteria bacterium HGW-Melainabacteria-1]|nr:MAG: hypothetical protein CVV27_10210 [Candidatus Melainabacteria bacterium HGW-Melainabacteria-1]